MKITNNPVPEGDEVGLENFTITYRQPQDTGALEDVDSDEDQFLKVSVGNGSLDEDGFYMNISTKRWSISSIEELEKTLRNFIARFKLLEISKDNTL